MLMLGIAIASDLTLSFKPACRLRMRAHLREFESMASGRFVECCNLLLSVCAKIEHELCE